MSPGPINYARLNEERIAREKRPTIVVEQVYGPETSSEVRYRVVGVYPASQWRRSDSSDDYWRSQAAS